MESTESSDVLLTPGPARPRRIPYRNGLALSPIRLRQLYEQIDSLDPGDPYQGSVGLTLIEDWESQ